MKILNMIEDFFKITTNLKKISRKGWETKLGITNPESVAKENLQNLFSARGGT